MKMNTHQSKRLQWGVLEIKKIEPHRRDPTHPIFHGPQVARQKETPRSARGEKKGAGFRSVQYLSSRSWESYSRDISKYSAERHPG